ncbi:unnamed protein product [Cylicocyclus nassatus]|uniref:Uncharacterized protein n=1 Tax=Cylicocyclus nassatus TaxID=53992 RepID=A0AA36M3J0_CYLNA|nr:unnamed protein product [Cylicocyclus nassatus]
MSDSYSATHYVPLMIQPDDTCYLPRIRRQKTPKIYPLVALPSLDSYHCSNEPSRSDKVSQNSSNGCYECMTHPQWKVLRVSRSKQLCAGNIDKNGNDTSKICPELKHIHLFVNTNAASKVKEPCQSQKKLLRISQRKIRLSQQSPIMTCIHEDDESECCNREKHLNFQIDQNCCK